MQCGRESSKYPNIQRICHPAQTQEYNASDVDSRLFYSAFCSLNFIEEALDIFFVVNLVSSGFMYTSSTDNIIIQIYNLKLI